jgi:hypothetical protein
MVEHIIDLRSPSYTGFGKGPAILHRDDADFLPAVLNEVRTEPGRAALTMTLARKQTGKDTLKLFQPVHRTFHVSLLEAVCLDVGEPRLDPARIESSGLVIRRIAADQFGDPLVPERLEAWMHAGDEVRGWRRIDAHDELLDPDPAFRARKSRSGHPEIDRRLAALLNVEELAESVSPMFVAAPDVCKSAGKTLLYGIVPLTSSETSKAPPAPNYPADLLRDHLPFYLRKREASTPSWVKRELSVNDITPDLLLTDSDLDAFVLLLRQLTVEFGAFGDTAEGKAFYAELEKLTLVFPMDITKTGGDFLKDASRILLEREGALDGNGRQKSSPPVVVMPVEWPGISEPQQSAFSAAMKTSLYAGLAKLTVGEGRYQNDKRLYRLRAFIRVKSHDGCPPRIWWSDPSERFLIAPWYDQSDAPPIRIALPEPADAMKLKPNVSFSVPKGLANILNANDMKGLMDGKSGNAGLELGWICSFSLPIITLCAFIVLNIFLALFDIIFSWMMFIKICIPIPVPKK